MQLQLLEHDELDEATAALARLRGRADVDAQRIGVVGHSFGGSLSLVMAARDPAIRAAVIFGGSRRQLGPVTGAPSTSARRGRTDIGACILRSRRRRLLNRAGLGAGRRDAATG